MLHCSNSNSNLEPQPPTTVEFFLFPMVCEKCESKLRSLAVPEVKRKRDVASASAPSAAASEAPARAAAPTVGGKMPSAARVASSLSGAARAQPFVAQACRICHTHLRDANCHYCQSCAYRNGICAMCGRKLVADLHRFKQSST
jgi:hypothetical protein